MLQSAAINLGVEAFRYYFYSDFTVILQ